MDRGSIDGMGDGVGNHGGSMDSVVGGRLGKSMASMGNYWSGVDTRGALVSEGEAVGESVEAVSVVGLGTPLPAAGHCGTEVVGAESNVAGVDEVSRGGGNNVDHGGSMDGMVGNHGGSMGNSMDNWVSMDGSQGSSRGSSEANKGLHLALFNFFGFSSSMARSKQWCVGRSNHNRYWIAKGES